MIIIIITIIAGGEKDDFGTYIGQGPDSIKPPTATSVPKTSGKINPQPQ